MAVIKIGDLRAFVPHVESKWLAFPREARRVIRIEFNSDKPFLLHRVEGSSLEDGGTVGKVLVAAVPQGYNVVEFVWQGSLLLSIFGEAEVHYYSTELEPVVIPSGDDLESFARLHVQPTRNYAQELIEYQRQQREEAFREEMRAEFERRLAARPDVNPVTGEVIENADDNGEAPADNGGASGQGDPDEGPEA